MRNAVFLGFLVTVLPLRTFQGEEPPDSEDTPKTAEAEESSAVPEIPPDPVAFYTFDLAHVAETGLGLFLRNAAGQGLEGRVAGATTVEGPLGEAFHFEAIQDAVSVTNGLDRLDRAEALTIAAWVRLLEIRGANYIVSKESWQDRLRGFVLRISASGQAEFTIGSRGWKTVKGPTLPPGDWHHLAATYEPGTIALWVDGSRAAVADSGGPMRPSPFELTIGRGNYDKERGFAGDIDEVVIYDRKLSEEEIRKLYQRGKSAQKAAIVVPEDPSSNDRDKPPGQDERDKPPGQGDEPPVVSRVLVPAVESLGFARHPNGRLVLLTAHEDRVEFRTAADLSFGEAESLPRPAASRKLDALEVACAPDTSVHVLTRPVGMEELTVYYARLTPTGKVKVRWLDLGAALNLELTQIPTLLPRGPSSFALFAIGLRPHIHHVSAVLDRRGLHRVRVAELNQASLLSTHGEIVGSSWREPWVLISFQRELFWVDFHTGQPTTCIPFRIKELPALDDTIPALVTREGVAVVVTPALDPEAGKGGGRTGRRPIRVSWGRPGKKLAESALLEDVGLGTYTLIESPRRAVYLVGACSTSGPRFQLKVWRLERQGLAEAGTIGLIPQPRRGLSAAFTGEKTLHVVFLAGDGDVAVHGTSWSIE